MALLTIPFAAAVAPVWVNSGHTLIRSFIADSVAINAGQSFAINASGRAVPATSATGFTGVATTAGGAYSSFDGLESGFVGGIDVSAMAYGAPVYQSDTAGTLATTAGATSIVVGRVVPVSDRDAVTGLPSKLLYIIHP